MRAFSFWDNVAGNLAFGSLLCGNNARQLRARCCRVPRLMLATEALVSEIPEEKKDAGVPGGHGGGMGGMY